MAESVRYSRRILRHFSHYLIASSPGPTNKGTRIHGAVRCAVVCTMLSFEVSDDPNDTSSGLATKFAGLALCCFFICPTTHEGQGSWCCNSFQEPYCTFMPAVHFWTSRSRFSGAHESRWWCVKAIGVSLLPRYCVRFAKALALPRSLVSKIFVGTRTFVNIRWRWIWFRRLQGNLWEIWW